ncbi:MAG: hypothetical protein ACREOG_09020, partial [Gemmatimonadaceae bacterium]
MRETMPDEQLFVPRAHVAGSWQGAQLDGEARVRLHQRGIVLAWHDGRTEWRVPFTQLSGVVLRAETLVLHGAAGSVTLTSTFRLAELWLALLERA